MGWASRGIVEDVDRATTGDLLLLSVAELGFEDWSSVYRNIAADGFGM